MMTGKIETHGLPLGPDPKAISGDGFLLAGDAASLWIPSQERVSAMQWSVVRLPQVWSGKHFQRMTFLQNF